MGEGTSRMGCVSFTGVAACFAVAGRLAVGLDRLKLGGFFGLIASPPPAPWSDDA
ncbi:NagN domain protein [Xanthomonas citri pv. punicae str. LMG 859]|nr:NagN domain protein [Xanthomonas citri pv. punicae str. LMG 859]